MICENCLQTGWQCIKAAFWMKQENCPKTGKDHKFRFRRNL